MNGFKKLLYLSGFTILIFIFMSVFILPSAFAKFYCPSGYIFNPKLQLCIGTGKLKGYNAIPSKTINVFKTKNHIYICPEKYVYSKKIQLCKGEGSLKGNNVQPAVKPAFSKKPAKVKKGGKGKAAKNKVAALKNKNGLKNGL